MISFGMSEDEQSIVEMVRQFALARLRPALREIEAHGLPAAVVDEFRDLGLDALGLPEARGGLGMGLVSQVLVQEELAFGDAAAAAALTWPSEVAQLAEAMGISPAADGLTLALAGERAALPVLGTEGPPWRLNGQARLVPCPPNARSALVLVRSEGSSDPAGIRLALLPFDRAGLTCQPVGRIVGLDALPFCDLSFSEVEVGSRDLVGGPAPAAALAEALLGHRVLLAAKLVGLGRAATEHAAAYALERKAFGETIANFQGVSFMIADMATEVEACRGLVWKAAWTLDRGSELARSERLAAVLAAWDDAAEMGVSVASRAVQVLGGAGYIQDHPVEKWMRDARALTALAGPDPRQLLGWPPLPASAGKLAIGPEPAVRLASQAEEAAS